MPNHHRQSPPDKPTPRQQRYLRQHQDRIPPRGDEADLFRRHNADLVRKLISHLTVSREVAEDAAQFAWAQFYRHQPERSNVMGWLYVTARHEVYATHRRNKREPAMNHLPERAGAASLDDPIEAKDTLRLLHRLKPQQRQVLRLIAAGYSYKEICQLTGHTHTWVNRHATEGRAVLRKLIQQGDP